MSGVQIPGVLQQDIDCLASDGRGLLPRNQHRPGRLLLHDFFEIFPLLSLLGQQHGIGQNQWRKALVDDPGVRLDPGPSQVRL